MQDAEVERGEAAAFQERDRERIAERELHQRGRGRREIVRAGFARLRQHQHDVGGLRERAVGVGGHGDQADAEAARIVDQVLQLGGLARPGQRQDHVVVRDHAEIAVARFARMHEEGGVPVEAKVAAILRPTWPDLPMPVTISRPLAPRIRSTAATNGCAEPVAHRGDERRDAAGLGLERAQRRRDQVAAAAAGRSRFCAASAFG